MKLNKQQWVAIGAIVGGFTVLPIVFAQIWQNHNPPVNSITSVNTGKTTTSQNYNYNPQPVNNFQHVQPINNQTLQPQDIPANQWQTQSNQGYSGLPSCEYYGEAGKIGIYHFKFPEASQNELVNVNGYKVHSISAEPLRQMIRDAKHQGVSLTIGSAFRSVEHQRGIVQRKKNAGQSTRQIYFVSSHPGFSEHHTGLAIDFTPINHGFAKTAGYRWLENNAHRYGFVKTFTAQYSNATGISEESWHWKYIGTPQAKAMLANGECYKLPKTNWQAL